MKKKDNPTKPAIGVSEDRKKADKKSEQPEAKAPPMTFEEFVASRPKASQSELKIGHTPMTFEEFAASRPGLQQISQQLIVSEKLFESTRKKLKISTDKKHGYDYVLLDILTSAYYDRLNDMPHFALVSQNPHELPFEGYIIPIEQFGEPENVLDLQRRAEANETIELGLYLPSSEIVAIHISISGNKDASGDYAKGCRPSIRTGILDTRRIAEWKSWRYLGELWFFRIWEKLELDRFNTDVGTYRANWKLKPKARNAPNLAPRDALLLIIAFLFNYWENQRIPFGARVLHLERLGCKHKLDAKALWTYWAEAGCVPQTKTQILRMLEKVQSESVRFYRKNPHELEKQKYAFNWAIKFLLLDPKDLARSPAQSKS